MMDAPTPLATPTSTRVAPQPAKVSGMTSISSGRSVCWTSQQVPATNIEMGSAPRVPFSFPSVFLSDPSRGYRGLR
jgi:hypothetical protein